MSWQPVSVEVAAVLLRVLLCWLVVPWSSDAEDDHLYLVIVLYQTETMIYPPAKHLHRVAITTSRTNLSSVEHNVPDVRKACNSLESLHAWGFPLFCLFRNPLMVQWLYPDCNQPRLCRSFLFPLEPSIDSIVYVCVCLQTSTLYNSHVQYMV